MTRGERRFHDVSQVLVGGTGLIFLVMAWLMTSDDEWAVVNHPWQPTVQHLHVLTAPLLVFAIGLIWRSHLSHRLRSLRKVLTNSGAMILALFLPMAASGYLLQISSEPLWRDVWAWVHAITGVVWVVGSTLHVLRRGSRTIARPTR